MTSRGRKKVVISVCAAACLAGAAGVASNLATAPEVAADSVAESMPDNMPNMISVAVDNFEPSAVELEVLERAAEVGRIDDADYEQAHKRYAECMTENGFEPSFRKSSAGFYVELPYQSVTDPTVLDDATANCSADTRVVESLYRIQQANPETHDVNTMLQEGPPKLVTDTPTLAVQCLQRLGVVGAEYTPAEFEKNWAAGQFPFDAVEPHANDCLYGAGYAFFMVDPSAE